VLQVCSKAYEFVFLGYSMPKDDLLTRAAIRRALKGNVDRGTLACAICDRSFDAAKLLNFQSVFGDGLTRRNYLEATFGQEKKTLGAKLQTFLSQARLLS
jgi:hypothetical protein